MTSVRTETSRWFGRQREPKIHRVACWVMLLAATAFLSNPTAKCEDVEIVAEEIEADGFPGQEDPQTQILTRYIRVNCALARRVCKLTEEQEQQLLSLDGAWLKAECQKSVKAPNGGAVAGFARMLGLEGAAPVRNELQPQQIIDRVGQAIDKEISSCLDEGQALAFKNEQDARLKFRRESHAEVIVGILDKRLFLTDDQRLAMRDSIADSLKKDVAWSIYLMNENYLPTISRPAIAKVLDKEQLAALSQWRNADFESFQFEQQVMGQQEQFVIEK